MALVSSPELLSAPQLGQIEQPRSWRWFDPILVGLLWIAMLLVGIIGLVAVLFINAGGPFDAESLTTSLPFNIGVLAIQGITLYLAVQAGLLWRRKRWADLGLGAINWRWLLIAAGVAVALRVLVVPVGILYQMVDPNVENPQLAFLLPGGQVSVPGMLAMFALVGVLIPFVEEAFFRGVVYTYLRRWGVLVATLVSALLFGIAHLNLLVGITAFILGLGCAIVYERSKSLTVAFVVHAVFNTTAVALLYALVMAGVQLPGI